MSFRLIIREQGTKPGDYLCMDTCISKVPSWAIHGWCWRHGDKEYAPVGIVECIEPGNPVTDQRITSVYIIVRDVTLRPFVHRLPIRLSAL